MIETSQDKCNLCGLEFRLCQCATRRVGTGAETAPSVDPIGFTSGSIIDGKYRIIEQIGRGGMGTIFKAEHASLGKLVAIKLLRNELLSDAVALARFENEARACSALCHPNLVTVFDRGIAGGYPYLVMEYIPGKDLKDTIKGDGPMPLDRMFNVLRQVASGLAFAHQHGVVHRDFTPSNVILSLDSDGFEIARIVDFGVAKIEDLGGAMQVLTNTGEVLGNPNYMSPEQCRGEAVDKRTDIYSFGCVLYEMIAGRQAFRAESLMAVIDKQLSEKPPAIVLDKKNKRKIPNGLIKLLNKCLEKERDKRYGDMHEVIQDLDKVAGSSRGKSAPPRSIKRSIARALLSIVVGFCLISTTFVLGFRTGFNEAVLASAQAAYLYQAGVPVKSTAGFQQLVETKHLNLEEILAVALVIMSQLQQLKLDAQVLQIYDTHIAQALDMVQPRVKSKDPEIMKKLPVVAPALIYHSGIALERTGQLPASRNRFGKGVKLSESLESPGWVKARLCHHYAVSLLNHEPKQPVEAANYLQKAMALIEKEEDAVKLGLLVELEECRQLLAKTARQ